MELISRPEFLECATDQEWDEWKLVHARTGQSVSPANTVKNFCDDCTPEYFEYSAERGRCFQAKLQDEEITLDEIKKQLT